MEAVQTIEATDQRAAVFPPSFYVFNPEAVLGQGETSIRPEHVPAMLAVLPVLRHVGRHLVHAGLTRDEHGEDLEMAELGAELLADVASFADALLRVAVEGEPVRWGGPLGEDLGDTLRHCLASFPERCPHALRPEVMALLARVAHAYRDPAAGARP